MDLKKKISRRQFIGQANCAAVGTASLLSSLLSLRLTALPTRPLATIPRRGAVRDPDAWH